MKELQPFRDELARLSSNKNFNPHYVRNRTNQLAALESAAKKMKSDSIAAKRMLFNAIKVFIALEFDMNQVELLLRDQNVSDALLSETSPRWKERKHCASREAVINRAINQALMMRSNFEGHRMERPALMEVARNDIEKAKAVQNRVRSISAERIAQVISKHPMISTLFENE